MKKSMFTGFSGALDKRGAAGAVGYAKALGFDGVEPYPCGAFSTIEQASELKQILDAAGMSASCVSYCVDLSGDGGDAAVEELKKLAELTAACGAPYLHHTLVPGLLAAKLGAPTFDRVFDDVVRRAGIVADTAKTLGITCLYEDQGFLFNGADRFERFLAALDRDNIGVCADFGNILFAGESPESFIGRFSDRVRHVHVKDYLYKPGSVPFPGRGWLRTRDGGYLRDTVPGHGVVDMVACLSVLKGAGYDGFYSFEFGGPEPMEQGLRDAMENLEYYEALAVHTL
ncbi:MAG: sugar phosphate isomerase/epimerase family protein [Clostridiaceae bacterium]|nr:sugar phosphate isomerase/epimerase family protein [Clostridiaceae bacterium]